MSLICYLSSSLRGCCLITRRRFLGQTGLLAAGAAIPKQAADGYSAPSLNAGTLKPWVDPLPLLPAATSNGLRPAPGNSSVKVPYYRIAMRETHVKVHRDLPPTRVWTYGN